MNPALELWRDKKDFFENLKLHIVISMCGEGSLTDGSETSKVFRQLLLKLPSRILKRYAEECLVENFKDSGLVLQDTVNQVGARLGFSVDEGFYRGKHSSVGYDGIWESLDGHSILVEVKTTDAYRISLDKVAEYRSKLIRSDRLNDSKSSLLLVVGRQDTGDLEAQIRGSRHSWIIRLISIDSLLKLMELKESLNDPGKTQLIQEILKPLEFTRVDSIVDLLFKTFEDAQDTANDVESEDDFQSTDCGSSISQGGVPNLKDEKKRAVAYHADCVSVLEKALRTDLLKIGRTSFRSSDGKVHLVCLVSKAYCHGSRSGYWYSIHPYQLEFLGKAGNSYVALGCGSSDKILLFPTSILLPLIDNMAKTVNEKRHYWHVKVKEQNGAFHLGQPEFSNPLEVTKYLLPSTKERFAISGLSKKATKV